MGTKVGKVSDELMRYVDGMVREMARFSEFAKRPITVSEKADAALCSSLRKLGETDPKSLDFKTVVMLVAIEMSLAIATRLFFEEVDAIEQGKYFAESKRKAETKLAEIQQCYRELMRLVADNLFPPTDRSPELRALTLDPLARHPVTLPKAVEKFLRDPASKGPLVNFVESVLGLRPRENTDKAPVEPVTPIEDVLARIDGPGWLSGDRDAWRSSKSRQPEPQARKRSAADIVLEHLRKRGSR